MPYSSVAEPTEPIIRYFNPDSSERSWCWPRFDMPVAQSTYSGIERSSRPRNTSTVFWALASRNMPPIEVKKQRVPLAVRGAFRRARAPGE